MHKNATWVGGPEDGNIVALPPDTEFVLVVTASATIRLSESSGPDELASVKTTKMRYPVVPGGPTGYRILYYRGVKSEE